MWTYENTSLNHNKYYIVFINDLTKFSWVYFLKQKSETLSKFIRFKASAETHSKRKIKTLRTDNGLEYTAAEFEDLLAKLHVKHQLTITYYSHQNGVLERNNKTLVEWQAVSNVSKEYAKGILGKSC